MYKITKIPYVRVHFVYWLHNIRHCVLATIRSRVVSVSQYDVTILYDAIDAPTRDLIIITYYYVHFVFDSRYKTMQMLHSAITQHMIIRYIITVFTV